MLSACSSGDTKADVLQETTRGETIQINREHTAKRRDEVVATYFSTPAAKDATAHLKGFKRKKQL